MRRKGEEACKVVRKVSAQSYETKVVRDNALGGAFPARQRSQPQILVCSSQLKFAFELGMRSSSLCVLMSSSVSTLILCRVFGADSTLFSQSLMSN